MTFEIKNGTNALMMDSSGMRAMLAAKKQAHADWRRSQSDHQVQHREGGEMQRLDPDAGGQREQRYEQDDD